MRQIENKADGETVETILVFKTEAEREEFFRLADMKTGIQQNQGLEDLRAAYMRGVKNIHEAFARSRADLRKLRETSLLEGDIGKTEYSPKSHEDKGRTVESGRPLTPEEMQALRAGEILTVLSEDRSPYSRLLMDSYGTIREQPTQEEPG